MDRGLVAFLDRSAVDGEGVDGVLFEDAEDGIELGRAVVADARFDGEASIPAGITQSCEDLGDLQRVAQ